MTRRPHAGQTTGSVRLIETRLRSRAVWFILTIAFSLCRCRAATRPGIFFAGRRPNCLMLLGIATTDGVPTKPHRRLGQGRCAGQAPSSIGEDQQASSAVAAILECGAAPRPVQTYGTTYQQRCRACPLLRMLEAEALRMTSRYSSLLLFDSRRSSPQQE
jgi:hypothetical protein